MNGRARRKANAARWPHLGVTSPLIGSSFLSEVGQLEVGREQHRL